ncbi:hypothetical protein ABZ848_21870 [Streptomyces sp. NPDC047081]|uniref:hypothetical protein n=1 Tax=Streptomyces sp. NPDC047081 TaxID=3154706 RepID=UPI0033DA0231
MTEGERETLAIALCHRSAALAADAVAELQDRLADALGTEKLRLHQRELESRAASPVYLGQDFTKWVMYLSVAVALAGSVYTWVFLP